MLLIALTVLPFTWVRQEVWRWQHWVLFADWCQVVWAGGTTCPQVPGLTFDFSGSYSGARNGKILLLNWTRCSDVKSA